MNELYQEIITDLRNNGYVADTEIATALFLADRMNKPLLVEGEAGVGKTEIARVLADMKNTELIRLQCYEGLDFNSALYEWNYQKQILSLRLHEVQNKADLALADFYTEEYLSYRPISRAMMSDQRVVLLLDEIDRADEEFEALLLETLAEYQLSIPELGVIEAKFIPHIVLTSNRTRELTDALRRRCLYLWIDYPSYEKELEVIRLKIPTIDLTLASQAASFVQALRLQSLNKVPGLSEAVDWTQALQCTGAQRLDRLTVQNTIGCLLKDRNDITRLKKELLEPLLDQVCRDPGV
ncbi:MAG: MoxR family ATPase [Gammaproteobacteria bacterium]|nr:MoxR family ATPase [Gammaproteobacteria bacterium]